MGNLQVTISIVGDSWGNIIDPNTDETVSDAENNEYPFAFYLSDGFITLSENKSSYDIDWGDSRRYNSYPDDSNLLSHVYDEPGEYTITFYDTVTRIDKIVPYYVGTDISTVFVPSSVTTLGGSSLIQAQSGITFESSVPPTALGSFSAVTLHIPTGSLSAYMSAENYPSDSIHYTEYAPQGASQEEQGQGTGGEQGQGSGDSPSPSSNPLSILYNHIKQLTKQWFYEKSEIDQKLLDKLDATDVPTALSDLTDDVGYLTEHQTLSDIGGEVTVEKQQSAESGYAATYVVKQNSTQVGVKINIPKDFLVKSGEVKTAAAADLSTLGGGYTAGDKYIDFVINTKEGDGTDEHMYINVKDLVEDTTYQADGATLTLSNGTFSITAGGVDTTELADSAVTTAKINDGAVTADKIASAVKSTWLETSDVDTEIEDYFDALTTALTPSSGSGE